MGLKGMDSSKEKDKSIIILLKSIKNSHDTTP